MTLLLHKVYAMVRRQSTLDMIRCSPTYRLHLLIACRNLGRSAVQELHDRFAPHDNGFLKYPLHSVIAVRRVRTSA